MKIKEIFYSIQGEGRNTGMPAVFVRVGDCNLRCKFCDTDFLSGLCEMAPEEVADCIMMTSNGGCTNVVFTGGEPLLVQDELAEVMLILLSKTKLQWFFAVETNGTIEPTDRFNAYVDWITCSPKGLDRLKMVQADEVKVVFTRELMPVLGCIDMAITADYYYLSPEAESANPFAKNDVERLGKKDVYPFYTNYDEVIDYCLENPRWRLSLQTHKLLNVR